jgi:hypothetical protein
MKIHSRIILLFLCAVNSLQAQEETIFMTADAGMALAYTPWKSFGNLRKEYNSTNAEAIDHRLGRLSDQYGYSVGVDCFVTKHYYTGVDMQQTYARASATFTNGAKRIFTTQTTAFSVYIGWLQPRENGYWTLSTGFNFAFGYLHSHIVFADGTRYTHTGGFSGEFHDLGIGVPLKFERTIAFDQRFALRWGMQLNYYTKPFDLGMQNTFVTQTQGAVSLNDKQVNFDISGIALFAGFSYKILQIQ